MLDELFAGELAFWDRELSLRGDFAEGVRNRLDPERMHLNYPAEISPYIQDLGSRVPAPIRVIDVGSGPLSMLALGARNGSYGLTCIDPLAVQYVELLEKHGHQPPWPLTTGRGEEIASMFPSESFDLAWSNNALDHAQDPAAVIRNIADVLAPGGIAIIQVWECEGTAQGWSGLHQHDFQLDDEGKLVFRSRLPSGCLSAFSDVSANCGLILTKSQSTLRGTRLYIQAVYQKQNQA